MVVIATFPWARGTGVPAWYVNSATVTRVPIFSTFIWIGGVIAPSSSTSASNPSSSGGWNGRGIPPPPPVGCPPVWGTLLVELVGTPLLHGARVLHVHVLHVHVNDRVRVLPSLLLDILGRCPEGVEVVEGLGVGEHWEFPNCCSALPPHNS